MDCVVFRVKGMYGLFKKPYTTTSALTFSCIHPPAIKGLVGAVMGIDRKDLHGDTSRMKVGIRVLSPVRKDLQSVKLISMKSDEFRFPANIEFLRDVDYEISVIWDSDRLDKLEAVLKERSYPFTPYLGVSEFIAKLDFVGRYDATECTSETIDSVIPVKCVKGAKFPEYTLFVDEIPVKNNDKREYIKYERVVIAFDKELKPTSIKCEAVDKICRIGDKCVFMF